MLPECAVRSNSCARPNQDDWLRCIFRQMETWCTVQINVLKISKFHRMKMFFQVKLKKIWKKKEENYNSFSNSIIEKIFLRGKINSNRLTFAQTNTHSHSLEVLPNSYCTHHNVRLLRHLRHDTSQLPPSSGSGHDIYLDTMIWNRNAVASASN